MGLDSRPDKLLSYARFWRGGMAGYIEATEIAVSTAGGGTHAVFVFRSPDGEEMHVVLPFDRLGNLVSSAFKLAQEHQATKQRTKVETGIRPVIEVAPETMTISRRQTRGLDHPVLCFVLGDMTVGFSVDQALAEEVLGKLVAAGRGSS